jgi:phage shock protein C
MQLFKTWVEQSFFGVCTYLGDKMGVSTHRVRLYFIYVTCAALGSPLLVYLILAFWVNIRKYLKSDKRHTSLDL